MSETPSTINIGTRYDGLPVLLPFPFMPHTLIAGITGSGKSSWTASIIGEVASNDNAAIFGIDLKRVELAGWVPRLTQLASTPDTATDLLSSLQQLVNMRSRMLEQLGLRTWDLSLGPAVLVVIDELAELAALDSEIIAEALADPDNAAKILKGAKGVASLRLTMLASLARLARFVAVSLICATQYPLASVVSSELRSNLTGRIGGRVTGREQVEVALGAGMSANIDPASISPKDQGVAYVTGFPNFDRPVRSRSNYPTDAQISARAKQTAHLRHLPETLFSEPPGHLEVPR